MKKILTLLFCGLFLLGIPMSIDANMNTCDENCIAQTLEDYVNPDLISVANGNFNIELTPRSSSKNLFVSNLYQNSYSNIMQECGETIANSGCALTSVAMVANYLNGASWTPVTANNTMGDYACPFHWYEAESLMNLNVELYKNNNSGLSSSYYNSEIYAQLNNNLPVIVGMKLANGNSHYVVVKGYTYNGSTYTFTICDPNRNSGKTTLNSYISSGATIRQLIVYS